MRHLCFGLFWLVSLGMGAYDSHFAWKYQHEMQQWEVNPLASWIVATGGLSALLIFKAAGLALAFGLAIYCYRHHRRLECWLTWTIGIAYLLLGLYYLAGTFHGSGYYGVPPERLPVAARTAVPSHALFSFVAKQK